MRIMKWLVPVLILLIAIIWIKGTRVDQQPSEPAEREQRRETFVRQLDADTAEYSNARFGFTMRFPSRLLIPQGESDNGDGQIFLSEDKKTQLITSGINTLDEDTLQNEFEQEFQSEASQANRKITFKTLKENWYVVSGFKGNTIFYLKRFLVDDHFVRLELSYPADQRLQWDAIVMQLEKDFRQKLPLNPD